MMMKPGPVMIRPARLLALRARGAALARRFPGMLPAPRISATLLAAWIGAAVGAFGFATPGLAQTMPGMSMDKGGASSPSSQGYRDAMMKMHQAMDVPLSGNPDRDFVTGMLAHHQGAIDMARVELRHGTDKQMRRLAQDIITAQEKEIAEMRAWLAKHPG